MSYTMLGKKILECRKKIMLLELPIILLVVLLFLHVFKETEFFSEQYSAISFYSAIRILACTVCLAVFS